MPPDHRHGSKSPARGPRPQQGHVARKRFGQHFLSDDGVIDDIVRAINPRPGQALVEIGPGLGAMTNPVVDRSERLTVVELDRDLAARLRKRPELNVVESDVLKVDFSSLAQRIAPGGRLRVVGNWSGDATLAEVENAVHAKLNLIHCYRSMNYICRHMEEKYGIAWMEYNFFGPSQIALSLRKIAKHFGPEIEEKAEAVILKYKPLVDGIKAIGAKRIALVAPYVKPLTQVVVDYIRHEGIDVAEMAKAFDTKLAKTSPERAAKIILEAVRKDRARVLVGADAVVDVANAPSFEDAAVAELIRLAGLTPTGKARLRDGRTGGYFVSATRPDGKELFDHLDR